jgi:hypothetical protein
LIGGNDPALVVEGHGHPGAFFMLGWAIKALSPKARWEFEIGNFRVSSIEELVFGLYGKGDDQCDRQNKG